MSQTTAKKNLAQIKKKIRAYCADNYIEVKISNDYTISFNKKTYNNFYEQNNFSYFSFSLDKGTMFVSYTLGNESEMTKILFSEYLKHLIELHSPDSVIFLSEDKTILTAFSTFYNVENDADILDYLEFIYKEKTKHKNIEFYFVNDKEKFNKKIHIFKNLLSFFVEMRKKDPLFEYEFIINKYEESKPIFSFFYKGYDFSIVFHYSLSKISIKNSLDKGFLFSEEIVFENVESFNDQLTILFKSIDAKLKIKNLLNYPMIHFESAIQNILYFSKHKKDFILDSLKENNSPEEIELFFKDFTRIKFDEKKIYFDLGNEQIYLFLLMDKFFISDKKEILSSFNNKEDAISSFNDLLLSLSNKITSKF